MEVHGSRGFEVLAGGTWVSTSIKSHTKDTVTIADVAGGTKLRYNWYSNPCGYYCFECAVYVTTTPVVPGLSGEEPFLPLPPFFTCCCFCFCCCWLRIFRSWRCCWRCCFSRWRSKERCLRCVPPLKYRNTGLARVLAVGRMKSVRKPRPDATISSISSSVCVPRMAAMIDPADEPLTTRGSSRFLILSKKGRSVGRT